MLKMLDIWQQAKHANHSMACLSRLFRVKASSENSGGKLNREEDLNFCSRGNIWQQTKHSNYTLACFSRFFKVKKGNLGKLAGEFNREDLNFCSCGDI